MPPDSPAPLPAPLNPAVAPTRTRPRRTALVAVGLAVLLAWYGTVLTLDLRPARLPASAAAAFVPTDGSRRGVHLSQGTQTSPAMTENALLTGTEALTEAMSAPAFSRLELPAGDQQSERWWREATIPDDVSQPSRYRIRSVDQTGVWLGVQDWGSLGLSFDGFLELPGDVRIGAHWSSSGQALGQPTDVQLTYRNSSSAAAPTDPARAVQGCLAVTSTTELSPTTAGRTPASPARDQWQAESLWCPGQGVVQEVGTVRGTRYSVLPGPSAYSTLSAAELAPPTIDLTALDRWTERTSSLLDGDPTFGAQPADLLVDQPVRMTSVGEVVFPGYEDADLTALLPLDSGELYWHWWARPGGTIVTTATAGTAAMATTTDRRLLAYSTGSGLRWTAPLDELALAPPLVVGHRVAVATLAGTISVYDLTDGRRVWSQQVGRAVRAPLASDGTELAVVDDSPELTVFDLATGRQRWQAGEGSPFGSTVALVGHEVVLQGGATAYGYDATSGRRDWIRAYGPGLRAVGRHGGLLWVDTEQGLQGWDPSTGRTRWTLPGAAGVGVTGSGCDPANDVGFALRGADLLAVTAGGAVEKSWPVPAATGTDRLVHCAAGRVWVSSASADGASSLTVSSVGPP